MVRKLSVLAVSTLLLSVLTPVASAGPEQRGSYVVVLKSSADPGAVARDHARDHGAQVNHVYRHAIKGYAATLPERAVRSIESDARVLAVNVDAPVHASDHTLGNVPTGVHRVFAPDNGNIDIDGTDDVRVDVDVAIIDTGIDLDHPDLNVAGGKNCARGSTFDDGNGHGSHVAGTTAGLDNGNVVGMAPGARLWAVRVLNNNGSGSWSGVICGIDWVTGHGGIEVANMSLGGSGSDPDNSTTNCATGNGLHDAICKSVQAGTTYAVAAGNESDDAANHVPAAYDEVITVSALADFNGVPGGLGSPTCRTDGDDTFANFSNFGADVDVIAPGVCIRSAWKGGGYNTISGTSMASPHVAGAAALYKARNPSATPSQVQTAIQTAGNLDWDDSEDPDSTKETLLDVHDALLFGVSAVNSPPEASDDSASTKVDNAVTVQVLANDSDANGDPLTVTNLSTATSGTAVLNPDQSVTYTPGTGFEGTDSFTYTANDGTGDSNVAAVTVTVSPNQAPVASNDDANTNKDAAVTINVLANDSDPDGDPLTVTNLTVPSSGTVLLNADQTVTYTPTTGFTGTESFTYTANDSTVDSNVATVTVNVVEPPATPALSVSVAKVGDTYRTGPWYRADLKVTVTDGTNPVESASVTLEVRSTSCTGASQGSGSGTTGSDGTVTFTFRSRTPGDYCALATATKSGYDPGSGSVLFVL